MGSSSHVNQRHKEGKIEGIRKERRKLKRKEWREEEKEGGREGEKEGRKERRKKGSERGSKEEGSKSILSILYMQIKFHVLQGGLPGSLHLEPSLPPPAAICPL